VSAGVGEAKTSKVWGKPDKNTRRMRNGGGRSQRDWLREKAMQVTKKKELRLRKRVTQKT